MDARTEKLFELAAEAGIDKRDIQEAYNVRQYVSLESAVDVLSTFFNERGYQAPTIDDLDDPDYQLD